MTKNGEYSLTLIVSVNTEVIEQQGLQSQATTVLTFMESKVAFWEHLMKAL